MSKEHGRLGFKSFKEFNVSLLFKWMWRLLLGSNALWAKVLEARYGNVKHAVLSTGTSSKYYSRSSWWSDLLSIESNFSSLILSNN